MRTPLQRAPHARERCHARASTRRAAPCTARSSRTMSEWKLVERRPATMNSRGRGDQLGGILRYDGARRPDWRRYDRSRRRSRSQSRSCSRSRRRSRSWDRDDHDRHDRHSRRERDRRGWRDSDTCDRRRGHGSGARPSLGIPRMHDLWSVAEFVNAHRQHGHKYTNSILGASWSALGKLVRGDRTGKERRYLSQQGQALTPLMEHTAGAAPSMNARTVSTVAHGLATVQNHSRWLGGDALWDALAERATAACAGEFNPHDLASTAWAYATAGCASLALFETIAKASVARVGEFKPQDLASTAHAFAKAGHASPALFEAIASASAARVGEFNPQDLASTAWAYATMGHASLALFEAIAKASVARVGEFNPQALANTAYAFAKAGHKSPALFEAIASAAAAHVGKFNAQNLANTAWAYATALHKSPALFEAIASMATSHVGEFNPQDLANTAWAFATVGHASPALFEAIASASVARVHEFKSQELANTVHAFAKIGHTSPALFEAIASALAARVGECIPQNLANTAWAFATVGHKSPALFEAIASALAERVGECIPQTLANTAWTFAACDERGASLFSSPRFVNRCEDLVDEMSTEDLNNLHQWQLWLDLERAGDGWPGLRPDVRERCRQAFVAGAASPSSLQRKVAAALADLDLCVAEEVRTAEGYSIDVVVTTADGRKVGVEVDGPWHFVGTSRTPNGATLLKRRQLRAAGWALLPVPYWEWDALDMPGDADAQRLRQREYLTRKLPSA